MKNKKKLLLIIIILIFSIITIYYKFYRIDFSNYSEFIYCGTYNSPDENYSIKMSILIPRVETDEYFILGELIKKEYISDNHQIISNKNTKIVYWDKKTGKTLNNTFYVKWINNTDFQIENKVMSIKGSVYDYRRKFLK